MSEKIKFQIGEKERRPSFRQQMREHAQRDAPDLQQYAASFKVLMQREEVRNRLDGEQLGRLGKLGQVWDVDVLGKIKAYEKGKNVRYRDEALESLDNAQDILLPVIDAIIEERLHSWGINLNDDDEFAKMSRSTQRNVALLPSRILKGKLSLDDIDTVVAEAASEISNPKKESEDT